MRLLHLPVEAGAGADTRLDEALGRRAVLLEQVVEEPLLQAHAPREIGLRRDVLRRRLQAGEQVLGGRGGLVEDVLVACTLTIMGQRYSTEAGLSGL